jgi:hypothetical protein
MTKNTSKSPTTRERRSVRVTDFNHLHPNGLEIILSGMSMVGITTGYVQLYLLPEWRTADPPQAVSIALERAKETIYIADWWLSPELFMRRPPYFNQEWRLDQILKRRAEAGVKIYVIVYREVEVSIWIGI